jgi:hypothetical protein
MPNEHFWRDASGRLTFEASQVDAKDYPSFCRSVANAFALTTDGSLTIGPDQMFWDFRRGDQAISLDWDIWMGFMVVAETKESEQLIKDIAVWISSRQLAVTGEQV